MGPNSGHNIWTVEFSFEYYGPITDVYNNDSVNIGAAELRQSITEPFFIVQALLHETKVTYINEL